MFTRKHKSRPMPSPIHKPIIPYEEGTSDHVIPSQTKPPPTSAFKSNDATRGGGDVGLVVLPMTHHPAAAKFPRGRWARVLGAVATSLYTHHHHR